MPGHWRFLSRSVVFVDRDRAKRYFRLRRRFDGEIRIEEVPEPGPTPRIGVLARSLVFRRRVNSRTLARKEIDSLLRGAEAYFPEGFKPARCCLVQDEDGNHLCALPTAAVTEFESEIGGVQGLLVVPDSAGPSAILLAIDRWQRFGAAADLASAPVKVVPVRQVALVAAVTVFSVLAAVEGWLIAREYPSAGHLAKKVATAEERSSPDLQRYESMQRMVLAQRAVSKFADDPGFKASDAAGAILRTVPNGVAIQSIEFKNGELKVVGSGSGATQWLAAQGVPADRISTYRLQQTDKFTAQFPPPKNAAP